VELDLIACAGYGEVADGLGEVEGGGSRRSRAGAADDRQGCHEGCEAENFERFLAVGLVRRVHWNEPSILRGSCRQQEDS